MPPRARTRDAPSSSYNGESFAGSLNVSELLSDLTESLPDRDRHMNIDDTAGVEAELALGFVSARTEDVSKRVWMDYYRRGITRRVQLNPWERTPSDCPVVDGQSLPELDSPRHTERDLDDKVTVPRSVLGWPLILPHRLVATRWAILVFLVDAIYTAFLLPYFVGFGVYEFDHVWLIVLEGLVGAVFITQLLLGFTTAFLIRYHFKTRVVLHAWEAVHYYLWKGSFRMDLLGALPALVQAVMLLSVSALDAGTHAVTAVRLLRLLRVSAFLKSMYIKSFTGSAGAAGRVLSRTALYFLALAYTVAFLINVLACAQWFVAEQVGLPYSWVSTVTLLQRDCQALTDAERAAGVECPGEELELLRASSARQYLTAVYYIFTTITTVGYGDISPVNSAEMIVTMIVQGCGILFFGFLMGSLAELMQRASTAAQRAAAYMSKMEAVDSWMKEHGLPAGSRRNIRLYYRDVWSRQSQYPEREFFEELPTQLTRDLTFHLTEHLIIHALFEGRVQDRRIVRAIASILMPITLLPGHTLFKEGQPATSMYLLQEGDVLALREEKELVMRRAPALIGEIALLSDHLEMAKRRPVTYRTLSACRLWEMDLTDLRALLRIRPRVYAKLLNALRRRIKTSMEVGAVASGRPGWASMLGDASDKTLRQLTKHVKNLAMQAHQCATKLEAAAHNPEVEPDEEDTPDASQGSDKPADSAGEDGGAEALQGPSLSAQVPLRKNPTFKKKPPSKAVSTPLQNTQSNMLNELIAQAHECEGAGLLLDSSSEVDSSSGTMGASASGALPHINEDSEEEAGSAPEEETSLIYTDIVDEFPKLP